MDPATCLSGLTPGLRTEVLAAYDQIVRNYREHRWEPSELNGGKLCEVVYSILKGHVDGKLPARAKKPSNMYDACKALEHADSTRFSRAVRIQIPRLLVALYEVRNNRGVGHTGGEVDPNAMDARLVLEMGKWIVADLVRIFHSVSTIEATEAVEALIDRTLPIVWSTGATKRVLDASLSMKDQTLLLLYSETGAVTEQQLLAWTEHSNASTYRRDVLKRGHKERLMEYDQATKSVRITPLRVRYVEEHLPLAH